MCVSGRCTVCHGSVPRAPAVMATPLQMDTHTITENPLVEVGVSVEMGDDEGVETVNLRSHLGFKATLAMLLMLGLWDAHLPPSELVSPAARWHGCWGWGRGDGPPVGC